MLMLLCSHPMDKQPYVGAGGDKYRRSGGHRKRKQIDEDEGNSASTSTGTFGPSQQLQQQHLYQQQQQQQQYLRQYQQQRHMMAASMGGMPASRAANDSFGPDPRKMMANFNMSEPIPLDRDPGFLHPEGVPPAGAVSASLLFSIESPPVQRNVFHHPDGAPLPVSCHKSAPSLSGLTTMDSIAPEAALTSLGGGGHPQQQEELLLRSFQQQGYQEPNYPMPPPMGPHQRHHSMPVPATASIARANGCNGGNHHAALGDDYLETASADWTVHSDLLKQDVHEATLDPSPPDAHSSTPKTKMPHAATTTAAGPHNRPQYPTSVPSTVSFSTRSKSTSSSSTSNAGTLQRPQQYPNMQLPQAPAYGMHPPNVRSVSFPAYSTDSIEPRPLPPPPTHGMQRSTSLPNTAVMPSSIHSASFLVGGGGRGYGYHPTASTSTHTPATIARRNSSQQEPRVYFEPCDKDVLLGRGGRANHHVGNQWYLLQKEDIQPDYLVADKDKRRELARALVDRVHSNGGRFLELETATNRWFEASNLKAYRKASQALREINTPEARAAKRAKYGA